MDKMYVTESKGTKSEKKQKIEESVTDKKKEEKIVKPFDDKKNTDYNPKLN